jgi:hypothetical protein
MFKLKLLAAAWAMVASTSGHAVVAYNEAVSGDLSSVGTSPTFVALVAGANQVLGTTGNPGTGTDRDYFTVTVPAGSLLTALTVLSGTSPLGLAFLGVQGGSQVTVSPTGGSPAGLLGWTHYAAADVGVNVLPRVGTGPGATGFTGALPAGSYAFWVQDFNPGASTYNLELTVAAVPETSTAVSLLAGLGLFVAWRQRRAAR